jgi:hypothetical protein
MRLATASIVILLFGVVWVVAAYVSRLLYDRFVVGVRRRYHLLPESRFAASQAAEDRRRSLSIYLERASRDFAEVQEFLEVPPDLAETLSLRFLGRERVDAAWHVTRLQLQLNDHKLLLLERVTDALVCHHRAGSISDDEFPVRVYLEPNTRSARQFPWRAVVVSEGPDSIFAALHSITEWLGIGVEIVKPAITKNTEKRNRPDTSPPPAITALPTGRCFGDPDALEGTVGGMITDGASGALGVTCRHVLSAHCGSLDSRCNPAFPPMYGTEFTQETPDVAFIRLESGCFTSPTAPSFPVSPADQRGIELAADRYIAVRKSPKHDSRSGVIRVAEMSGFKLGDHFYRGIHFAIVPHFVRRFGIIWSLWRSFSKAGDSGSWITLDEASWMGMVVGAFEEPVMTIALSAAHIRASFERLCAASSSGPFALGSIQYRAFR